MLGRACPSQPFQVLLESGALQTHFTDEKSDATPSLPAGYVAAQQAEALRAEGGSWLPADVRLQGGSHQPAERPHPAAEPALHSGVPPGAQVPTPPTPAHSGEGKTESLHPASLSYTHTQPGRGLEAQGLLVQRGDVESEADVGPSLHPAPWGCRGLPPGTAVRMVPCSAGFPEAQVCGLTRPCPPLLQGLCILEPECEPLHGQRALALLPAVVRRGPLRHL